MKIVFAAVIALTALTAAGCSKLAVADGSLDYKKSAKTMPLKVPNDIQMRPPQALYPAPSITERALEQAPAFVNAKGNRFELIRPTAYNPTANTGTVASKPTTPQSVQDGHHNPLLLIHGAADDIWRYTTAALSTANLNPQSDDKIAYRYHIDYQSKKYQIGMGNSSNGFVLAVFDGQNYAEQTVAQHILDHIVNNWPQ